MKLKNKNTGELREFIVMDGNEMRLGVTLEDLMKDWEDYEDELYYIISAEHKDGYICALKEDYKELCKVARDLGLGFETEEEAKKAVERLKAFKRLKDKGFKFKGWRTTDLGADKYYFVIMAESDGAGKGDLDLLFGGEE